MEYPLGLDDYCRLSKSLPFAVHPQPDDLAQAQKSLGHGSRRSPEKAPKIEETLQFGFRAGQQTKYAKTCRDPE